MNIQQFLEENQWVEIPCKCGGTMSTKEKDTRLINFILGEVGKEVEKRFGFGSNEALVIITPEFGFVEQRPALKDISTIINNLRVM